MIRWMFCVKVKDRFTCTELRERHGKNDTITTRYAQRAQISAEHGNPEDPDFGLWTPGSEA